MNGSLRVAAARKDLSLWTPGYEASEPLELAVVLRCRTSSAVLAFIVEGAVADGILSWREGYRMTMDEGVYNEFSIER